MIRMNHDPSSTTHRPMYNSYNPLIELRVPKLQLSKDGIKRPFLRAIKSSTTCKPLHHVQVELLQLRFHLRLISTTCKLFYEP